MEKICFKCSLLKPLEDFYKHKQMSDGHLNKCKVCTKNDTSIREQELRSTPEGLELDRKRHRDKYRKLNYKDQQKIWDKDRPWKNTKTYKNLHRRFRVPKGKELHHWNYNEEYLEDVIILETKDHRNFHRYLSLDLESRIFKDKNGNSLDTKEKHLQYYYSLKSTEYESRN